MGTEKCVLFMSFQGVLIRGVSSFQGVLIRGVPLSTCSKCLSLEEGELGLQQLYSPLTELLPRSLRH